LDYNKNPSVYLPSFLQIIGKNLKRLSLNELDEKLMDSILTHCTNINSLEIYDLHQLNYFFTLIKNLELTKLKISMYRDDDDSIFLLKLIDYLPVTLNSLVLENLRTFNNLQHFLEIFHAPNLSEIILHQKTYDSFFELLNNIKFIEFQNVHTFGIEYDFNVCSDDINDFNQLQRLYNRIIGN
ncbi:17896_t:CDS:1, partial [Funneliformis geosporum]